MMKPEPQFIPYTDEPITPVNDQNNTDNRDDPRGLSSLASFSANFGARTQTHIGCSLQVHM